MKHQTVDAEIKAITISQRARAAESRVAYGSSNGPRRAQSKAVCRVFCDVWHALAVGDMQYPMKAHGFGREQGGTADK